MTTVPLPVKLPKESFETLLEGLQLPAGDRLGYVRYDPNCRGAIVGDCVKRAIVVAAGVDYHSLEVFMNRTKVKKDRPFNDMRNVENTLKLLKAKTIKMSVPAGTKRWHVNTIGHVMKRFPKVRFVLQVSKHLIGVRSCFIHDLFDDRIRDKGIYKMWLFGATPETAAKIQALVAAGDTRRFL